MANQLARDTPRIGNVFDDDDGTPQPRAMLQRTETGVLLTIPWDQGETQVYERWFSPAAQWGDDPDRTKYRYDIPTELVFRDVFGTVHLVGCRFASAHGNWVTSSGQGSIRANVAVFGGAGEVGFAAVHGVRSEVSGLRQWLGVRSVHRGEPEIGPSGLRSVSFTVLSPDEIPIPGYPTLTLEPRWKVEPGEGATTLHEQAHVVTRFESATDWSDHFSIHTGIRDLLSISAWAPQTFTALECLHDESPVRTIDGTGRGDKWLDVSTTLVDVGPAPPKRSRAIHFIEYEDLGPDGIARWLDLRRAFDRAIAPIEASVYLSQVTVEVRLMQLGAGLEALAFLLMCRDGFSARKADDVRIGPRLELIANRIQSVIPFDGPAWAVSTAAAYNAVKHAKRPLPDPVDLANRWQESVVVFRLWLALELGVDPERLRSRIEGDRQLTPFVTG